MFKNICHKTL